MSDGEVYDEEAQRAVEAICKERDELKARVAELERRNAATVKFTSEEIECIKMSSLLALRVLDDYCDEHPGVANKRNGFDKRYNRQVRRDSERSGGVKL